jgi:hypothetical protein
LITFTNDSVSSSHEITDFENLGEISVKDLGASIPYYGIYSDYTSDYMPNHSEKVCSGDCFEYFTKGALFMVWYTVD